MVILRSLVLAGGLALAGAAAAHVAIQPRAVAGGYQVLRFVVGHGCDGQATTRVAVSIPPALDVARPQPKPGWKLKMERIPSKPEKVTQVSWTGRLPADQFDEFLIQVKLPAQGGAYAFPTVQSCGRTNVPWTGADPAHPPPKVDILPSTPPEGGHDHSHQDTP